VAQPIIPQNQIDSFPLLTVAQANAPDKMTIQGGQVQKYWGQTSVGIDDASVQTDGNSHVFCVSNYLDMTGCSNGAVLVRRTNTVDAVPGALAGMQVRFQYRLTPTTTMPTSTTFGGAPGFLMAGMQALNAAVFTFAAMATGSTEYGLFTWGPSATNTAFNPSPVTIGSDVRVFISFVLAAVGANNKFAVSVWGSS